MIGAETSFRHWLGLVTSRIRLARCIDETPILIHRNRTLKSRRWPAFRIAGWRMWREASILNSAVGIDALEPSGLDKSVPKRGDVS